MPRALNECEICGLEVSKAYDLSRHMRTHGDKPYKCICGEFAAAQKSGLKIHINKHTREKPFKCDVCERGFGDPSSCHKHMKSQHGYQPAKTKPKAKPKYKAAPGTPWKKPYSPPSQPVRRISTPTPEFLPPSMARKTFASSFFVDALVAEPSSGSSHLMPVQGLGRKQLNYSIPVPPQQFRYSTEYFVHSDSQSYPPTPDYSAPNSQGTCSPEPTPELSTPSPIESMPQDFPLRRHKHPLRYGFPPT